jgi:hypothetical protein
MSNQDDLQNFVLTTLDKQGVIEDSANLKTANGADIDQLALLGALNSLRSKDVRANYFWALKPSDCDIGFEWLRRMYKLYSVALYFLSEKQQHRVQTYQ